MKFDNRNIVFSISESLEEDGRYWDEFVETQEEGTFFHKFGWKKIIEESIGHRTYYLIAKNGDNVQGIFPLVHVKSWLFGSSLISTPFCACGGVLAINQVVRKKLEDYACELAGELAVDYLEVRNRDVVNSDWPMKNLYVNFSREISSENEENLLAIPRKQRAMVRKGIKAALDSDTDYDIDRFYSVYAQSFRNLGTPVFSKKIFNMIRQVFPDESDILTISSSGQAVSSVMNFYYKDQVLPYFGGGTAAARSLYASDFMYWDLMCRSAERGIRIFDYGRSKKGTGAYSFKKNWGFMPAPLSYEYYLVKAAEVPNYSPANPKYRYFIEAWKHLPMPVANAVGPFISRSLG